MKKRNLEIKSQGALDRRLPKKVLSAAFSLGAIVTTNAALADATWGQWIAGGTSCNSSNVQVIENGGSLAVLFDEFGVNMPQNDFGDGTTSRKTCTFRIQMTPKKGFYLARMKQVYRGGIIKSSDSSAQLNIRYNIGSAVGRPLPITFPRGQRITPESDASQFSRSYQDNLLVYACGGSTTYGINMSFTAQRSNNLSSSYLVGGLDSVDADFVQRVELIPEWAACP